MYSTWQGRPIELAQQRPEPKCPVRELVHLDRQRDTEDLTPVFVQQRGESLSKPAGSGEKVDDGDRRAFSVQMILLYRDGIPIGQPVILVVSPRLSWFAGIAIVTRNASSEGVNVTDEAHAEEWVEAVPNAGAMIESLRAVGYSPQTAVADLIDNSIAAHARSVNVTFWWNGSDSWVSVSDDGNGMSPAELTEAMRPGTMGPLEARRPEDLGRFGLGLKTASFSQCRRLTVVFETAG